MPTPGSIRRTRTSASSSTSWPRTATRSFTRTSASSATDASRRTWTSSWSSTCSASRPHGHRRHRLRRRRLRARHPRAAGQVGVRCEVISFRPNTSSDLMAVADEFTDIMKIASIGRGKEADKARRDERPADARQGGRARVRLPRGLARRRRRRTGRHSRGGHDAGRPRRAGSHDHDPTPRRAVRLPSPSRRRRCRQPWPRHTTRTATRTASTAAAAAAEVADAGAGVMPRPMSPPMGSDGPGRRRARGGGLAGVR